MNLELHMRRFSIQPLWENGDNEYVSDLSLGEGCLLGSRNDQRPFCDPLTNVVLQHSTPLRNNLFWGVQ